MSKLSLRSGRRKVQPRWRWRIRLCALYCVATPMRRMPELSAFESAKSMIRVLPPKNTAGLARGMLAKAVHNAAWTQIVQHTTYKAANAGGVVKLVDPRGTSRTCPECGTVAAKALSERVHRCECGCILDRDVAAARVILQRANFGPGHGLQARTEPTAA